MSDLLVYKGIEEEKHEPWEIVIHTLAELDDVWNHHSTPLFDEDFFLINRWNQWVSAPVRSNCVINIQGDVARSE